MRVPSEIRQIKASVESDLLERPGVVGIDIGHKYVHGEKTENIAIRFFVEEKREVPANERIPSEIQGVQTDVIERKIVLHPRRVSVAELETKVDAGTYDPLQGGISIGTCRVVGSCVFVGTLGAVVTDNATGDPMMLSNFHVMCVDNNWSVGDTIAQPSRVDGGSCPTGVVGQLQRASLGGQVDCAVARITNRDHICEIVEIGAVAGTADATIDMPVRKRGRTTELTFGEVDSIDLTVRVPFDDPDCGIAGVGTVTFRNQIGIVVDASQSTQFGDGGDSGSVVVDSDRNVIGLYFAGSPDGTFGVANPIQAVLDALDVSICVPKAKEFKEFKEFKEKEKELKEFKEFKEFKEKEKEFKEIKEKEKELKEFKEKDKELKEFKEKEFKEFKEKDKDIKEIRENFPIQGIDPRQPRINSIDDTGQRLANLEASVGQLMHFISAELRPDLSSSALRRESDQPGSDLSAQQQQLQKQATDAKQAKDNKDIEKLREG